MKIKVKQKPKIGDIKEKIKFAIFPVKVNDLWIWLEKYIAVYEYKTTYGEYDEVITSGIFTEKYTTREIEFKMWVLINRKLI